MSLFGRKPPPSGTPTVSTEPPKPQLGFWQRNWKTAFLFGGCLILLLASRAFNSHEQKARNTQKAKHVQQDAPSGNSPIRMGRSPRCSRSYSTPNKAWRPRNSRKTRLLYRALIHSPRRNCSRWRRPAREQLSRECRARRLVEHAITTRRRPPLSTSPKNRRRW